MQEKAHHDQTMDVHCQANGCEQVCPLKFIIDNSPAGRKTFIRALPDRGKGETPTDPR